MIPLNTTVNDKKFNTVFKEVPTNGAIGVRGNEQLRLFRLRDIIDNNFDKDSLREFIAKNIGAYVFSRSKVKKYYEEGEETSVGYEALEVMQQRAESDKKGSGTEIGEIMLYIFLESVLRAPKIYSRIELNTSVKGHVSSSDSIHLKMLKENEGEISYEMVFGISNIVGDLGDAIDAAFLRIEELNNNKREEIRIVDDTVFNLPENDPAAETMKELLRVIPGREVKKNSAFGIFLGYTIGLEKNISFDKYHESIDSKMDDDILAYLPQIKENIERLGLNNNSFYIYVFPFDDAEADKKEIMKKVMREDIAHD